MPIASNQTAIGGSDSHASFGDYLAGGLGGQWKVFEAAPLLLSTASATCDFSLGNSFLVNLIASTATTITLQNVPVGMPVRVTTQQPSSGIAGTVIWAGSALRWSGGTTGAPTGTNSICDTFTFYQPFPGAIGAAAALPNF